MSDQESARDHLIAKVEGQIRRLEAALGLTNVGSAWCKVQETWLRLGQMKLSYDFKNHEYYRGHLTKLREKLGYALNTLPPGEAWVTVWKVKNAMTCLVEDLRNEI